MIETIVPESMRKSYDLGHFAPAVKSGCFIFVSGIIGKGESAEDEFRSAWQTAGVVLGEAGAGFADIVDTTLYIVDLAANAAIMARVKDEFIQPPYPASTWIGVAGLIRPVARAEIKIIARVSS
jgi:enamine deaminase RidA (YjgF/YER057c/UK114 family)